MKRLLLVLSVFLAAWASASNVPPTVRLEFASDKAAPGERVRGTVTVRFAEGLYAYQNPPTEPFMIPVTVTAGNDATKIVGVEYPRGTLKAVGGSETPVAVYTGTIRIPVTFAAPAGEGATTLAVRVRYQQCDESQCYAPGTKTAEATLTLAAATTAPPGPATGGGAAAEPETPTPTLKIDRFAASPRTATVDADSGLATIRLTWQVTGAQRVELRDGQSRTRLDPLKGDREFKVKESTTFRLTATDAEGNTVRQDVRVTVEPAVPTEPTPPVGTADPDAPVTGEPAPPAGADQGAAPGEPAPPAPYPGTGEPDGKAETTPAATPDSRAGETFVGGMLKEGFQTGNYLPIILGAILVGLLLCLTPCVYPVIPITVTYFGNQKADSRAAKLGLGLMYMFGIAMTYGAVGGVVAALGGSVGTLFTRPWFLFMLAAIMVVLALSMFDLYEIRLPGFVSRNLKGRSGPVGALIMGLLMGFAAAPCAGALVSAIAIDVANTGSILVGLVVFTAIGIGLGLPFVALAAFSTGAKGLPKSGGWLTAVKAVLGLIVLWLAFDYLFKGLGLRVGASDTLIAWTATYLVGATFLLFFEKSESTRAVWAVKGTAVLALGLLAGMSYSGYTAKVKSDELARLGATAVGGNPWQPFADRVNWVKFTDESFARAKASGLPILIDGTADWCAKCQEIDRKIFQNPAGIVALRNVATLKIDHSTGVDQAYIDKTTDQFNIKGLPHIVYFKPGGEPTETVFDIPSVEALKASLRKAGGQ